MKLWTVTAVGVYDQGTAGVFSTLEKAEEVARIHSSPPDDGYHDQVVREFTLDGHALPEDGFDVCRYNRGVRRVQVRPRGQSIT